MYTIIGLGNPGEEYKETRHNTGKMVVERLEAALEKDGLKAKIIHQDTFMNKSGSAVAKVIKSKKAAEKLVVIYDDMDLPVGELKFSWNRGSGGHKGLESIMRAVKTKEFIRLRIGIGKKEPVEKHILGKFTPGEKEKLKKVFNNAITGIEMLIEEGLPKAMSVLNQSK